MTDKGKKGMVVQRQRRASGSAAQVRPVRRDGWTPAKRRLFMEALAATCNVTEAARVAGKSLSSAYKQKQRDPGFAREWHQALCVAYDELEALLLRQSLFGTEQEEVVLDGEGAVKSRKVKRDYPLAIGLRLLLAHAGEVAEQRRLQGIERPDGEDAIARLRAALEAVRKKGGWCIEGGVAHGAAVGFRAAGADAGQGAGAGAGGAERRGGGGFGA